MTCNTYRWKYQQDEKYIKKQAELLQYLCVRWCVLYKQYWFRWFSHRFRCFQPYRAFEEPVKSQTPREVEVLSQQKSEVLPFSVMLTRPHCQSDRAAHQTSAPTPLSHTEGGEKRCQIIWQAKWDIFIRSSTPSQTGAKASWGNLSPLRTSAIETKPACPFYQWLYLEIRSPFIFPVDGIETS